MIVPKRSLQVGPALTASTTGVQPVQDQTGRQLQAVGEQAVRLGASLHQVAERKIEEINVARVKNADNLLADLTRRKVAEFQQMVGADVLPGKDGATPRERLLQSIESEASKLAADLDSDEQRVMFESPMMNRLRNAAFVMEQHEVKQHRAYTIGQTKERIDSLSLDAIDSYRSQGTSPYHARLKVLEDEVRSLGELVGSSPEQIDAAVREERAKVARHVFGRLFDEEDYDGAREFLDGAVASGDMTKAEATKARRDIEKVTLKESAARDVLEMYRKANGAFEVKIGSVQHRLWSQFRSGKMSLDRFQAAISASAMVDKQERARLASNRAQVVSAVRQAADAGVAVFEKLGSDVVAMADELGIRQQMESYLEGRARGATVPPLTADELRERLLNLENATPAKIKSMFPLEQRNELVLGFLGPHATDEQIKRALGVIDEAYGIDSVDAQASRIDRVLRERLSPYVWAHETTKVERGRVRKLSGEARLTAPMSDRVLFGVRQALRDRLANKQGVTQEDYLRELDNMLGSARVRHLGAPLPAEVHRYVAEQDLQQAKLSTSSGDIPLQQLPEDVVAVYRSGVSNFFDLPITRRVRLEQEWLEDYVTRGKPGARLLSEQLREENEKAGVSAFDVEIESQSPEANMLVRVLLADAGQTLDNFLADGVDVPMSSIREKLEEMRDKGLLGQSGESPEAVAEQAEKLLRALQARAQRARDAQK